MYLPNVNIGIMEMLSTVSLSFLQILTTACFILHGCKTLSVLNMSDQCNLSRPLRFLLLKQGSVLDVNASRHRQKMRLIPITETEYR